MARDPDRIDEMLDLIRQAWHKNPDQRLLQLLLNLIRSPIPHPELFSLEDQSLKDRLNHLLADGSYPAPINLPYGEAMDCRPDGGSVQIKAVTSYGDPVDCSADEAREFAKKIVAAARNADDA